MPGIRGAFGILSDQVIAEVLLQFGAVAIVTLLEIVRHFGGRGCECAGKKPGNGFEVDHVCSSSKDSAMTLVE